MKLIQSLLIIILLFTSVFLFYKTDRLSQTIKTLQSEPTTNMLPTENEVHIGEYMQKYQYYVVKLYFAGKANNTTLIEFYAHELEEYMEELATKGAFEDGINISQNIELYGLKSLETFEKKLAMGNDFEESYSNLINGCNSCHKVSKHPFIQITVPKENPFNQDF